ncbi:hypothetical protein VTI74DRAFT_328 [Chaetomium olivicolor]
MRDLDLPRAWPRPASCGGNGGGFTPRARGRSPPAWRKAVLLAFGNPVTDLTCECRGSVVRKTVMVLFLSRDSRLFCPP